MSISSMSSFNKNRVTGMTTGMDTDALVKSMVMNQQLKYDKIFQNKTLAEWKKESYTNMNNTLRKFKDDFISTLSTKSLALSSSYKAYSVNMADNTSVKVSATSAASVGVMNIGVEKIATAASVTSSKTVDYSASVISGSQIRGLTKLGADSNMQDGSFTINGVEIEYKATDSLKTIMDRVNNSKAGVTMSYSQITGQFKVESKVTGARGADVAVPENPGAAPVFNAEGLTEGTAAYETAKSQYEVDLAAYNVNKSAYDTAVKTNADNASRDVKIEDNSGFMSLLGISTEASAVQAGQDAVYSINGQTKTSSTNKLSVDGVDITLLASTNGSTVSASIERNVTDSVNKIKDFVEQLNKLLKDIYTPLSEKKNRSFSPLTDTTKEGLSEEQVKDWNDEAKKGILYRDNYLDTLMNDLRAALGSNMGGLGTLSSIGITSTGYKAGEAVQLEIDEAKLTAALNDDPDKVQSILSSVAKNSPDGKGGFVTRIGSAIDRFTNDTKGNPLQTIDNNIRDYTKKMSDMQDRINDMADRYYKKFAKMESALASLNEQSSQIASYFPS